MAFYRCLPPQSGGDYSDFEIQGASNYGVGSDFRFYVDAETFNSQVEIGEKVTFFDSMFRDLHNFNQPITLRSNANCIRMLMSCYNFNSPIVFADNVQCQWMLANCYNFNQPITWDNSVNAYSMLSNCHSFNQPIVIPTNTYTYSFLQYCYSFNQPIVIPESPKCNSFSAAFFHCNNFNYPVVFPNTVDACSSAFAHCYNLNSPITIGANVNSIGFMLDNCKNFGSDVFIKGNSIRNNGGILNATRLFNNCNNLLRKNVWFHSSLNDKFNATVYSNSIIGEKITWTDMIDGNGFYNTAYNIYCYNNYSG